MLTWRVARTRLGHTLPKHGKHYYHTKSARSNPVINKSTGYTATVSVVIAAGVWWLQTAFDDVPHLKSQPTEHSVSGSDPSEDEVTRMLSQEARSLLVRNVAGVDRFDEAQLASNSPCEDRFTHGLLQSPWNDGNSWMAWAVFDGHAGWQTADLLEKQLLPFVQRSLSQVNRAPNEQAVLEELVQRAVMEAFVDLDNSIVKTASDTSSSKQPLHEKMRKLVPAFAGSCALLSIYDPITSKLYVACTGDSRAVLGQKNSEGQWEAMPLSIDQTGSNQEEVKRLSQEHPGEEEIVKNGRVLGLVVSRAFGDGRWKWPLELQKGFIRRFYGPALLTPTYNVQTPPYITAEPVMTTTTIDPSKPSFLIMATDGMWDTLTDQQAVNLVGTWLEAQTAKTREIQPKRTYKSFDFSEFWNGVSWKFVEERTTVQDDNVAVHLIRNSLGGNHHELIAGRLAVSSPFSRRLRDDITVQVVLFNAPHLVT